MSLRNAERKLLARLHAIGVQAVRPDLVLPRYSGVSGDRWVFRRGVRELGIDLPDRAAGGRLRVIALGKAARSMARGFSASLEGSGVRVDDGLIVTRDLAAGEAPWPELQGDHPLPGERSERAARAVLEFIGSPTPADRFVVLLSGGASALCALPAPGVTLAQKRAATRELMLAGAPIEQINELRTRLSAIKGGKLARRMAPARVITLAVSDVWGDDPRVIGSGPTFDPPYAPCVVIATLDDALEAISAAAVAEGLELRALGRSLYGTVADEAQSLVERIEASGAPDRPRLWLAGGEPVLEVRGAGRGGRAQEFALRIAAQLDRHPTLRLSGLVAGTDGSDGPTEAAGGFFDHGTTTRLQAAGIDLSAALADNDSHTALGAVEDLFVTGPTGTNVADLVLALQSTG